MHEILSEPQQQFAQDSSRETFFFGGKLCLYSHPLW